MGDATSEWTGINKVFETNLNVDADNGFGYHLLDKYSVSNEAKSTGFNSMDS